MHVCRPVLTDRYESVKNTYRMPMWMSLDAVFHKHI